MSHEDLPEDAFPALFLSLSEAAALAQASSGSKADEKDIRQLGTQIQDAWNKFDPKMMADLWLVDGDCVSSTGRSASGRAEVEKAFAEQWSSVYKGTRLAHTITSGVPSLPAGSSGK